MRNLLKKTLRLSLVLMSILFSQIGFAANEENQTYQLQYDQKTETIQLLPNGSVTVKISGLGICRGVVSENSSSNLMFVQFPDSLNSNVQCQAKNFALQVYAKSTLEYFKAMTVRVPDRVGIYHMVNNLPRSLGTITRLN